MEEALHEMPVFRKVAKLDDGAARLPRHLGLCGARPSVLWQGSGGREPAAPQRLQSVAAASAATEHRHQAFFDMSNGGDV